MRIAGVTISAGQLAGAALSVAIVLAPLSFDLQAPIVQMIVLLAVSAACAAVMITAFVSSGLLVPRDGLAVAAGIFAFWIVLSAVFSIYQPDAWRQVFFSYLLGALFITSYSLGKRVTGFGNSIALALITTATVQALIGMHQFLFSGWYEQHLPQFHQQFLIANMRGDVLRAVGTFRNANYFAALINLALPLVFYRSLMPGQKWLQRILHGALSLLLFGAIVLSGSKMALIVSGLLLTVILVKRQWLLIFAVIALALLLVIIPNPLRDSFIRGMESDQTFGMRVPIWRASAEMAFERPFTGTGPANYHYVSHLHAPANENEVARFGRFPRIAHNSVLHVAAETGLPGGIAYAAMVLILLWRAAGILRGEEKQTGYAVLSGLSLPLAVAFAGIALHSLVDNVLNLHAIGLVTALVAPLALAGRETAWRLTGSQMAERERPAPWLSACIITALIVIAAAAFVVRPLYYEHQMQRLDERIHSATTLLQAPGAGETTSEQGLRILENARRALAEVEKAYPAHLAVNRQLGYIHSMLFQARGTFSDHNKALHHYRQAGRSLNGYSRSGAYSMLQLQLSLIQMGYQPTNELVTQIRGMAEKAIRQWPNRAYYHLVAASIELQLQEVSRAREYIDSTLEIEPSFLQAYIYGDRIGALTGNLDYRATMQRGFGQAVERVWKVGLPELGDDYGWLLITPDRRFPGQEWLEQYSEDLASFQQARGN